MTLFPEKLRLREMAEEDIYFARRDVELIEALHKKRLGKLAKCGDGEKKVAKAFEQRFEDLTQKHKDKPHKLLRAYRGLLDDIKKACRERS
ncbi:hypothetical protein G3480_24520 [Thiorhodococcus mannitoliphagus]|uniref:Uncharacterized protein n=1 Tax=Thiorhodococcus mannitoliphagus TaxID=329406 RepID=A0A6P1E0U7_9GAMM|nr:hypothetical protein [Thiorhodococcus mannitoliphagus]NEX23420.1 hypothetical protein [Thiorhodococcus mannitoliphagus]